MKALKNLNTFALLLPLGIGLLGVIDESMLLIACLSTMITGLIQVLIGLFFWFLQKKNTYILIYLVTVIFFFTTWYFNSTKIHNNTLDGFLFMTPPLLAVYLSVIIYSQKETR